MNTPVNFELAKLLKEKGLKYYSTNNYFYNEHGKIKYGKALNTYNDYPAELDECDAPAIAEVVMWLYQKHGIWISVSHLPFNQKFAFRVTGKYNEDNKGILHGYTFSHYETPTEAYEAAIEYTLTNII